jgi:hypothetical protein
MSFKRARGQWLTPVILATQEDHGSKPAWANCSSLPYLQKHFTKIRLVECLKVKTLSLSPSNSKKKKKKKNHMCTGSCLVPEVKNRKCGFRGMNYLKTQSVF